MFHKTYRTFGENRFLMRQFAGLTCLNTPHYHMGCKNFTPTHG